MEDLVNDPVNHPNHYTYGTIEPIDVIEDWNLGFHLGNALKYIARAEHKDNTLEDLKKARWYLDRAIAKRENPNKSMSDAEDVLRKAATPIVTTQTPAQRVCYPIITAIPLIGHDVPPWWDPYTPVTPPWFEAIEVIK